MTEAENEGTKMTILQEIDHAALHRKASDKLACCLNATSITDALVAATTWGK